jgi:GDP-L-fucose synthase
MENLGWKAEINLEDGIKQTYQWFLENKDKVKEVKM